MLIRVMYLDNSFDMVCPSMLDVLLEKGEVSSFLRSEGWVTPSADNLRRKRITKYFGPDRRNRREVERRKVS